MGKMPWIKVWTEMIHDPKLGRLSDAGKWLWTGLLVLAGMSPQAGTVFLTPGVGLTPRDLALALHIAAPEEEIAQQLTLMESLGMISRDHSGIITIRNWIKRQHKFPSWSPVATRERVRKHRQSKQSASYPTDSLPIPPPAEAAGSNKSGNNYVTTQDVRCKMLDGDVDERSKRLLPSSSTPATCSWCLPASKEEPDELALIRFHHQEYNRTQGECPDSSKAVGRWRKDFQRLLKGRTRPDLEALLVYALGSPADWVKPLGGFINHFDDLVLAKKKGLRYGEIATRRSAEPPRRHDAAPREAYGPSGKRDF